MDFEFSAIIFLLCQKGIDLSFGRRDFDSYRIDRIDSGDQR